MEQVTKKYKCRISEKGIFWTINSIDKPDKRFFISDYLPSFKEVDFTPNFLDQFSVEIVLDKSTYTMIEITDLETNEVLYFVNSNITKKLNKGFICKFDLDLWLSYSWDYLTFIANNALIDTCKVNRLFCPWLFEKRFDHINGSLYYINGKELRLIQKYKKDPLINFDNFQYLLFEELILPLMKTFKIVKKLLPDGSFKETYSAFFNPVEGVNYENTIDIGPNSTLQKPLVYIYEGANGTYICLVRLASNDYARFRPNQNFVDSNATLKKILASDFTKTGSANYTMYYITTQDGAYAGLGSRIPFLANKFVGCFEMPFINNMQDWVLWDATYGEDGKKADNDNYLLFTVDRDKAKKLFSNNQGTGPNIGTYTLSSISFKEDKFSPTDFLNDIPMFLSSFVSVYDWNYKTGVRNTLFNNMKLTFDGSKFNVFYSLKPNKTDFNFFIPGATFNEMRGTLNISTDSYNDYVNQTKINQNTSLKIAKQQMGMGIIGNVLNGVMGVGSAIATGNIAGGISSGLNSIMGIGNSILKYQNQQKQMDAQNQTARNTAQANNLQSSVTSDDVLNKIGSLDLDTNNFLLQNRFPVRFTQSNAVLLALVGFWLKYGWNCDEILPLGFVLKFFTENSYNSYFNNDYVYFDLEIEDDKLIRLFKPNANIDLINAISLINKNSFRIWKSIPFSNKLPEYIYINMEES